MKKLIWCATALAALFLTACKPTEKNYKMAYDLAQERLRAGLDEDEFELISEEKLPPYQHGLTDSVRVQSVPLMWQWSPEAVDSGKRASPKVYNLSVGTYKMLTNAKAHAGNLAAQGWKSAVMRSGAGPTYYVVIRRSDDLDSVAHDARTFTKQNPNGLVGQSVPIALRPLR